MKAVALLVAAFAGLGTAFADAALAMRGYGGAVRLQARLRHRPATRRTPVAVDRRRAAKRRSQTKNRKAHR